MSSNTVRPTGNHYFESSEFECDCGEKFWADPVMEENVTWNHEKKIFVPECPGCHTAGDEGCSSTNIEI